MNLTVVNLTVNSIVNFKYVLVLVTVVQFTFGHTDSVYASESLRLGIPAELSAPRIVSPLVATPSRLSPQEKSLFNAKKEQLWGSPEKCLSILEANVEGNVTEAIRPWVLLSRVECAIGGLNKGLSVAAKARRVVSVLEKSGGYLSVGPWSSDLRKKGAELSLLLAQEELKRDRLFSKKLLDRLFSKREDLSKTQIAKIYRLLGEIDFIDQNLASAEFNFRQSISLVPDKDLRNRVISIQKQLGGRSEWSEEQPGQAVTTAPERETQDGASDEERAVVSRMSSALMSGDLASAFTDGVKLLQNYPGGSNSSWADQRIIESLVNILEKKDPNLSLVKDRVLRILQKAPAYRTFSWGKSLYFKAFYAESLDLIKSSCGRFEDSEDLTSCLSYLGKVAVAMGNYSLAAQQFETLTRAHAGSTEGIEALFRMGLLRFRQKDFASAISHFERLLVLPKGDKWELQTRYWLWRSLLQARPSRAKEEAEIIIQKFPLSYYGLQVIAKAEAKDITLDRFARKPQALESLSIFLSGEQKQALARARTLIKIGWSAEAQAELSLIDVPNQPKEQAFMAQLWVEACNYPRAIALLGSAWDQDSKFRSLPFLSWAFPTDFDDEIRKQASANSLSPFLIRAVIRQESAYDPFAVSSSNAMGLMQLIGPTAKEMADLRKISNLNLSNDVFRSDINIQLGSFYLRRLLDKYEQYLPFAIGAYNVGPTRLDRWIQLRPLLTKPDEGQEEVWMDELPWSETSFYVKAVLRNALLYKLFEEKSLKPMQPAWSGL